MTDLSAAFKLNPNSGSPTSPAPVALSSAEFVSLPGGFGLHVDGFVGVAKSSGEQEAVRVEFGFSLSSAADGLKAIAAWLEHHEALGVLCAAHVQTRDGSARWEHPLTDLYFTEAQSRKASDDPYEQACSWGLSVRDDGAHVVWFEHGGFGYREETVASAGAALARLAALAAGELAWENFGSPESRRTLLKKGQFYWAGPESVPSTAAASLVPVDNFVFEATNGHSLKLDSVGERSVLAWNSGVYQRGYEWFDNKALALERMADIVAGLVALSEFGSGFDDEEPDELPAFTESHGSRPLPKPAMEHVQTAVPWLGRMVVRSIFENGDVHAAPMLVYKTGEGRRAALVQGADDWQVVACLSSPRSRVATFSREGLPQALKCWAQVLRSGLAPQPEFEWQ